MSNKLSIKENTSLIEDYVAGLSKKEISKKYNIPYGSVDRYVQKLPNDLQNAKLDNTIQLERENNKIQSLKEDIIHLTKEAIEEAHTEENKLKYVDKIASLLEKIDKIFRLNVDKPTEHTKQTNVEVNIAEIIKQAKTPEDRLKILQSQFYENENQT